MPEHDNEMAHPWGIEPDAAASMLSPADGNAGVTADGRFVDGYDTTTQVLAKVPHLPQSDGEADFDRSKPRADGRLISQRLSAKLLLAGGVVVVLAAILPFTLNKMRGSGSGQEGQSWRPDNPAPDAAEAPPWSGSSPQANMVQPIAPNAAIAPLATQPSLGWSSGDLPQNLGASSPSSSAGSAVPPGFGNVPATTPQANLPSQQSAPGWTSPPDVPLMSENTPAWNRQSRGIPAAASSAGSPSASTGPAASPSPDPAAAPANASQGFAPASTLNGMGSPQQQFAPTASGNPYQSSPSGPGSYRSYEPPQSGANQRMTLDPRTSVDARYPQVARPDLSTGASAAPQAGYSSWTPPPTEPGVARFEGIIEKPTLRTSYDASRSSIH